MSTSRRDREDTTQERAIEKSIDETKDSARKVLSEVKRELPEVTSTFHDYQEQNINSIREMTNTYLESQKEVAKSMAQAMRPFSANPFIWTLWPWAHPQILTENYVRAVTALTETSVSAAKSTSEMAQVMIESGRSSINFARENTRALSKYYVDTAHSFGDAANAISAETSVR